MRFFHLFLICLSCSFFVFLTSWAEEEVSQVSSQLAPVTKKLEKQESINIIKKKPQRKLAYKKKKRRWKREKETEGSKALGRFKANSVLKSKYRLKGRELEVDPD